MSTKTRMMLGAMALIVGLAPPMFAETIYSTDFGSGLDNRWTVSSTSSDGVVQVAPRGSHAHVLNMNLKGSKQASHAINSAVLELDVARHKELKLSFDHFADWDAADTNPVSMFNSSGMPRIDGIMISTNQQNWELAWVTPSGFTNGMLSVKDLDLGGMLSSRSSLISTGKLFIRFQHHISFAPGQLRSDGRGWDNVSVSGVSAVPEPTALGLFLTGAASAGWFLRRRR